MDLTNEIQLLQINLVLIHELLNANTKILELIDQSPNVDLSYCISASASVFLLNESILDDFSTALPSLEILPSSVQAQAS
jgi:hypothetical protein